MLVCDVCNRWYHFNCTGLDGVDNKRPGYTMYTCDDCNDRAHCRSVLRGTHESSETDNLRQTNSCIKRNVVVNELSETNVSSVDQKLDRIESVNTRQSNQAKVKVDDDDDDVIVLD